MQYRLIMLIKHITEATGACLLAMMQGNLLMLGLSHWIIATQTGLVAGVVATSTVVLAKIGRRWVVATILGAATAIADFFVHSGPWSDRISEAAITGLIASLLSFVFGFVLGRVFHLAEERPHSTAANDP